MRALNIQRSLRAAGVLATALALSVDGMAQTEAPANDTLNLVAGENRSKHFDAVVSHLNLGGSIFAYMDVDGDVEKLAGLIQDFLKKVPANELPPHIAKLDLANVLSDIGIDGVEAMGMSSYKNGELFHNRAFIHVPAGRKGILKVSGGAPGPFVAGSMAPADSDLIVEQTINLAEAYKVMSKLVKQLGGEEAHAEFLREMGEVNPQLGLSMANLFGKMDTRLTVAARVHPDKPLDIPDAPFSIPSFDFVIALDDLGWLYDKVTGNMKAEMPADQVAQMFVKGDGFEKIPLPPMPSPDMVVMQPIIHNDIAGKRIYMASSQAFLDECLAGKTKLSDSADFKKASAGLPTEGNGLSYVSADFMKAIRGMYTDMMDAASGEGDMRMGAQETAMMSLLTSFMPKADIGQAKVTVNEKDGIFVSSNSTASMKEGFLMSGAGMMAVLGTSSYRSMAPKAQFAPPEAVEEAE